jgi:hypothetical protein
LRDAERVENDVVEMIVVYKFNNFIESLEQLDVWTFDVLESAIFSLYAKNGVDAFQEAELIDGAIDKFFVKAYVGDSHKFSI